MGDRWNINNDNIEAQRYREEVPLRWRIVYAAVPWIAIFGVVAIAILLRIWLSSKGW